MHPYALAAVFGTSLTLWVVLLMVEAKSGTRLLPRVRGMFDHRVTSSVVWIETHLPHFNRYYFKQLFHYVVHLALSALLFVVAQVEKGIKRIAHLNRSRAQVTPQPNADSHLSHMLAHKETSALSPEEKEVRKAKALRGNSEG